MLTDTALRNLKPKSLTYKASDRDGMYVTVSPTGTVTFRYDYRLNGRRETLTIGRYGPAGISLAMAREKLIDAKKAVAQGKSPALEKQRDKRRLTAAKTFGDVTEKWLAGARMADSTKAMRKSIVDRDILPAFKNRQLNEITADDLRALCNKVKARGAPATAVHVRDIVKQVYAFAILHGETELYNVDRVSKSEGLDDLPSDYSKLPAKVPELGPPLPGDLGPAIVKSQQPVTPTYAPPGHDPEDARRKEADAAAASSVFFRSGTPGKGPATGSAQVAAAGSASTLAGFDPLAAGPASTAAQPTDPTAAQNRQDQKEAFLKGGSTETRNSGNLQMPASPYQVMAGTVIAGALVMGIKSDLPGDVIATVTEPVYDTATGKFLLIPQGSRILGKYNSQVSYGQSRVQVVWNRIILPDTSSLKLDNLAGTDPAGYAGLEDGVDWHWDRVFAGAALTTLLGVGAELAAPQNRQDGNHVIIAGRDSLQDSVNQVGQEMTRRNMNIQPTLTERPGLPVRIIVNRDLMLRPYQPLFFSRGAAK